MALGIFTVIRSMVAGCYFYRLLLSTKILWQIHVFIDSRKPPLARKGLIGTDEVGTKQEARH